MTSNGDNQSSRLGQTHGGSQQSSSGSQSVAYQQSEIPQRPGGTTHQSHNWAEEPYGHLAFLDDPTYWGSSSNTLSYANGGPLLTEEEIAEIQRQRAVHGPPCGHTAADRVESAQYKGRVDDYYNKLDGFGRAINAGRK